MRYLVSKKFKKSFGKLPQTVKRQFVERRKLFEMEPYHPLLHNHALGGKYSYFRSFNVNGYFRAIFEQIGAETVHLIDIGAHSQLYG